MLNALSVFLSDGDAAGQARAVRSLQDQGFSADAPIDWAGGRVLGWMHPGQARVANERVRTACGTACCVGPLWYRGAFGARALEALLEDVATTGRVDESVLRGSFALFLKTADHIWLLNDGTGFVHLHASADGCFFSTSWLAVCAYLGHVGLDAASAIEYVLLGAAHSRHSVARGIDTLALGQARDLANRRTWSRFPHGMQAQAPAFDSLDEAVEAIAGHLRTVSAEVAAAFAGRVNVALSAGFDSRLIVAGLLAAGVQPQLFVYGAADTPDVVIAEKVAAASGLALEMIDKNIINRDLPQPDIETLEQNARFFDGLPNDGIDDPGADRRTRLLQNAAGSIALNGGGGEILRNFFHLPDRRFTAGDIVKAFYRGFSPRVFRSATGLSDYESRLAASMRDVLGMSTAADTRLERRQVELLYPLFRCHYWMGVNNGVAVRHGYYATPLVDPELVRLAQRVPLRWKQAGTLESRLIAALHPGIAAQPSGYGFRFDTGPDRKARFAEWATCARPVRLRPLIGATRRRLQHVRVASELLERYRKLLPGPWCMDPLLDLRQLPDAGALGRALAVEVVWRRIL